MARKEPALVQARQMKTYEDVVLGICVPVYNQVGNANLAQLIWSIGQCSDLPYQLSLGVGPVCVARNRLKAEARLDPSIKYVMHVDDDVLLPPHFASKLVCVLSVDEGVGAVSALMSGARGEPQNDLHPTAFSPGEVRECLPPGTCFVYNRERTPIVWDAEYQGSQWEDTDGMMQIKAAGKRLVATADVQILHKNNLSQNKYWNQNRERFVQKWPGVIA